MLKKLLAVCGLLLQSTVVLGAMPEMRAHFIDVGQGASTLLEFPCGAVLIDTGAQDDKHADHLADYLEDFFKERPHLNNTLDLLIISHPHIDHTRGIKQTFSTCRVARYLDSGILTGSGRSGPKFVRECVSNGIHQTVIREVRDSEILELPGRTGLCDETVDTISCLHCDPRITVLSGGLDDNPGWTGGEFDNLNNHSIVLRVDFGESSFLFTGDLEECAIETLVDYYRGTVLLDVDVYLVGHHGSHNGTTASLVEAMTPEIAVFGVGKSLFGENPSVRFSTYAYGHPRRSVVELLSSAIHGRRGRPIDVSVADRAKTFSDFRVTKKLNATGWDGDIIVAAKLDGSMRVTTSSSGSPSPIAASEALALAAAAPAAEISATSGEYRWNLTVPEKKPASGGNGKLILFDVSHGGTSGQSDWVIDGGFSDFSDALVDAGYTVREYRGVDKDNDGMIRFYDDRRHESADQNEAVIEFSAIKHADVFIMAETNRPLTKDERSALVQFVALGKGLFLIADHYNADRNLNSWDATEVFNGYNRSTNQQFDMGGRYGDLRNPGDAYKGWLAENFGVRFRFNAIDCKAGVSDILAPEFADQITEGVNPILMAAGATLAIVDPSRAKGLVYFSPSDPATSWNNAIEGPSNGIYFGGHNEGPYVAISKPNAGKAAFIGDSSPIEDKTAKYANEQTGGQKRLHDGWKGPGSASVLCLNLINWLSTPESYVGFDSAAGRMPGIATPNPLAVVEEDDPDDGDPWRAPRDGYDPWNTNTYAAGAFGARFPVAVDGPGGDSQGILTVAQALHRTDDEQIVVEGFIQTELNDQYGLKLAASMSSNATLAVQLPSSFRSTFNPLLNPAARGQKVRISGKRGKYMGLPGMRAVQAVESLAN